MKYTVILFFTWICVSCSTKVKNDTATADSLVTPAPEAVQAEPSADSEEIGFAFSNPAGTQLLRLNADSAVAASAFTQAITTSQKPVPVSFKTNKPATDGDNGRQTPANFANSGGDLYEVAGTVDPEQTTLLCTPAFLATRKLLPVQKSAYNLSASDTERITAEKKRKIKRYHNLGTVDNARTIGLVEFERQKDSVLVSLVIVTPNQILYRDFPALYNETSTWRVDDGGEFTMDSFRLLAVFEHEGTLELVTEWIGAEGYALEYLVPSGKQLSVKKEASRYSAPD